MIIWFDKDMQMHVDKSCSADNSFALAKYGNSYSMYFKANAVVEGNTVLFTHSQVTSAGASKHDSWVCQSTGRKYFLQNDLSTIENAITKYLRTDKKYRGKINVRFCVGISSQELFEDLGYKYIRDSHIDNYDYWGPTRQFVIVEKSI
jgi:hypothetical protein